MNDDKIIENDNNTASILNKFFTNIITTPGIPQYTETEPVSHNISDPLMKGIMKYRLHPSIVAIKKNCNSSLSFSFSQVERHEIMKAAQSTDIPPNLFRKILVFLEILYLETIIIMFPILFFQTP